MTGCVCVCVYFAAPSWQRLASVGYCAAALDGCLHPQVPRPIYKAQKKEPRFLVPVVLAALGGVVKGAWRSSRLGDLRHHSFLCLTTMTTMQDLQGISEPRGRGRKSETLEREFYLAIPGEEGCMSVCI